MNDNASNGDDPMADIKSNVINAKSAAIMLSAADTKAKDNALNAMADALDASRKKIIDANEKDMSAALKMKEAGELTDSMVKRLIVNNEKMDGMIAGIKDVIKLKDPAGETMSTMELDDGLTLYQIRCPIGLIGVIFESRPDVVPQVMSLCLKSGNAVVFKGGKEASNTNKAIFDVLSEAAYRTGIPKGSFCLMETREDVSAILEMDGQIDLLIPRGSNEFVRYIQSNTKIPVLGHAAGICHVYVDADADTEKALSVSLDSKIQYPAVCNAVENLLVNKAIAKAFLPKMVELFVNNGVEVRADEETIGIVGKDKVKKAKTADWDTEYNDMIISIKMVDSLDEAIDFINKHGSKHTDSIVTENMRNALRFSELVDSSSVLVNASTRFSDGFRYGKGAEVGISTNKVHSRGPVGMEGLMIYKYVLVGNGHIVKDYAGKNAKKFKHVAIDKDFKL
ncbi:MAG: glutamate-5-semialdehyde dehydrogenase [Methanomassiliicoccaceae archaeon]|jgi:glutamate-5-semialdehyde dehydrogenase|nr:glutamate-5-semialdehyde dehydrogenase [Methanomassiliicoccaceae archaeon]